VSNNKFEPDLKAVGDAVHTLILSHSTKCRAPNFERSVMTLYEHVIYKYPEFYDSLSTTLTKDGSLQLTRPYKHKEVGQWYVSADEKSDLNKRKALRPDIKPNEEEINAKLLVLVMACKEPELSEKILQELPDALVTICDYLVHCYHEPIDTLTDELSWLLGKGFGKKPQST